MQPPLMPSAGKFDDDVGVHAGYLFGNLAVADIKEVNQL